MSDFATTLKKLQEPFPETDIEWRVLNPQQWGQFVRCSCFPYVTARAIHQRLDDVVGPQNWCNTPQQVFTVGHNKNGPVLSVQVGISIRCDGEWLTKYNVSEPTHIELAKGGFSGAEKRAGEEWGIGRYLWFLGELDAKTTMNDPGRGNGWFHATLPQSKGGKDYWWRPPQLPSWALPPASADRPVTVEELNDLKRAWVAKFAPEEKSRSAKVAGFNTFCVSLFGGFPIDTPAGWTHDMLEKAHNEIKSNSGGGGPTGVPFEK